MTEERIEEPLNYVWTSRGMQHENFEPNDSRLVPYVPRADYEDLARANASLLAQVKAWEDKAGEVPIAKLVDRFLSWPLPKSVASDGCVTNPDYPHSRCGTNLLTADEARQMLEYVLGGARV